MDVSEIPADEVVEMTATFNRAFMAARCRPQCHACLRDLPVGVRFKLATYKRVVGTDRTESREVMLCDTCESSDIEPMARVRKEKREEERIAEKAKSKEIRLQVQWRQYPGGCFRVDGKIVLELDG